MHKYQEKVVTAVVVYPNLAHVLPLEPEFIQPQDGHDKQDCEIAAAKRWLKRCGATYAAYSIPTRTPITGTGPGHGNAGSSPAQVTALVRITPHIANKGSGH